MGDSCPDGGSQITQNTLPPADFPPSFTLEMTLHCSMQIGAVSVALNLTLPTLPFNLCILSGKAIFGSISQMVKLRLSHTQRHAVTQWQSRGQAQPSLTPGFYISLPATNNKPSSHA